MTDIAPVELRKRIANWCDRGPEETTNTRLAMRNQVVRLAGFLEVSATEYEEAAELFHVQRTRLDDSLKEGGGETGNFGPRDLHRCHHDAMTMCAINSTG